MTTKLNLTIEESTAKAIKAYAEKKKVSVSKLAEAYFNHLAGIEENHSNQKQSFVEKYAGIVTGKLAADIDAERDEYLKGKYGI